MVDKVLEYEAVVLESGTLFRCRSICTDCDLGPSATITPYSQTSTQGTMQCIVMLLCFTFFVAIGRDPGYTIHCNKF